MPVRMRAMMAAMAAAAMVFAGGCAQNAAVWTEPDVEWMLPEAGGSSDAGGTAALSASDTVAVYAAPGLGASDALGYEIFVRHDERLAQSQMVSMMALADATPTGDTLWLDAIPGDGGGAMYDLFAGGPVRYAEAPSSPANQNQPITSVDGDAINE